MAGSIRLIVRCALVALFSGTLAAAATAQTYPNRPVRLIVPFAPGGSNDVFARVIAAQLTDKLGQSVFVDNRAGAGGVLGTDIAAKSTPDGYTLLLISSAHAVNASLAKNLPFDPVKSFAPIALLGRGAGVLTVHPDVPVKSVGELVTLAKQKPGQLNAGAAGLGSFQHMSTEMFKLLAGIDIVIVQYKGGGPSMADLLAGHIQMVAGSMIQMMPHIESGALRPLGVTGPSRNSALPNVPTIAEAGVAGYEAMNWWGIIAPAGTSNAIVTKLHDEATAVATSAEMRQRLGKEGAEPATMSIPEFAKYIEVETVRWAKVVKDANVHVE
jgi:tripartite-type tricarboxylate transporter receptor subunit TctC